MTGALVVDVGTSTSAAMVVSEQGTWLVPDPLTAARRWPSAVHWDGYSWSVGAQAEQRRSLDPAGFATGFKRALDTDDPVLLGQRRLRPTDLLAEFLGAMRVQAQRQHGAIDRAVLTVPAGYLPDDPRRSRLLAAAEAAGLGAADLVAEGVAAVAAPMAGPPFAVGNLVLVYDLGATFEASLVRVGADRAELLGHASILDWGPDDQIGADAQRSPVVDHATQCARRLLAGAGFGPDDVDAVLPIGGGGLIPGLEAVLQRDLGMSVRHPADRDIAIVGGAAQWLRSTGARTVAATPTPGRIVPVSFPIPGSGAQLIRWLVRPDQPYGEGATLARIRLPNGAVWDLVASSGGTLDQILVNDGTQVRTGDWLALARH
jgi:molecular chaperone DnaK (HSP70)